MNQYRWFVTALIFFVLGLGSYAQYQLPPIAPRLMEALDLSQVAYASAFVAPMMPAIFLSLPAGFLADRFGVRRVVLISLVVTLFGFLLRPFATSFAAFYLSMFCLGVSCAVVNAIIGKIAGQWFKAHAVSGVVGLLMTGGLLGMVVAMATTSWFSGPPKAFVFAAVLMCICAVFNVLFLRDGRTFQEDKTSFAASLRGLMRVPSLWLIGFSAAAYMVTMITLVSMLPIAFQAVRGFSEGMSGRLAAVFLVGSLFGTLAGPQLERHIGGRWYLSCSAALSIVLSGWVWRWPEGAALFLGLFISGATLGGCLPVLMSYPVRLASIGPLRAGTAGGIVATMQLFGAVVVPSHILLPLSDGDYGRLFVFAGLAMIVMFVAVQWMHHPGRRTSE